MHNSIAIGTSLKLDRRTRTLSNIKDGSSVTLPASACRCLRALVEEKEKVLSYEQLMDIGWRNSGVEVTENSVRVMITKIRRALATLKVDDRIQLIAVTRSGYRLIVNIEALVITDSAAPPAVTAPLAIATAPPSVEKPRIWPRRMLAATAGALLGCVMVLLLSWFFKVAPQRIDFVRWQGEAVPPDSEVWVPQGLLSAAQKETITDTLKLYSHYAAGNEPNAEKARYLYITIGHSSHHMGLIACTIPLRASENNCESYYFTQR
ncbi:transcriptional regulator [Erwinia aphidicola]|uniref:transcriptional regulator n=1 Tax=Erwinia aphidicola TaxID=68334 RepID=UPI00301835F8